MGLIYNYILGYDTDDNTWFHNVDAESDFMEGKTVFNTKYEEYIAEYQGDGIYLSDAERLIKVHETKLAKFMDEKVINEKTRGQLKRDIKEFENLVKDVTY